MAAARDKDWSVAPAPAFTVLPAHAWVKGAHIHVHPALACKPWHLRQHIVAPDRPGGG
jgi:hypothetical protein